MMALAASNQKSSVAPSCIVPSTPANFVASSGSPMTPVEARYTSRSLQPTAAAADCAVSSVAWRPFRPVNALALPELTTTARATPWAKFCRQKSTGAEGHLERVKTPATEAGSSNTISSTSVRFLYLMPAAAVAMRTPRSAGMEAKVFGASGETEPDIS